MEVDPPSVVAIKSYLANKPRSLERVIETFATRGILLSIGFAILDNPKTAIKNGALASLILEAYLLYFYSSPRFYPEGQYEQSTANPNASGVR